MSDLMRGVVRQHVEKDTDINILATIEGLMCHLVKAGIVNEAALLEEVEATLRRRRLYAVEEVLKKLNRETEGE